MGSCPVRGKGRGLGSAASPRGMGSSSHQQHFPTYTQAGPCNLGRAGATPCMLEPGGDVDNGSGQGQGAQLALDGGVQSVNPGTSRACHAPRLDKATMGLGTGFLQRAEQPSLSALQPWAGSTLPPNACQGGGHTPGSLLHDHASDHPSRGMELSMGQGPGASYPLIQCALTPWQPHGVGVAAAHASTQSEVAVSPPQALWGTPGTGSSPAHPSSCFSFPKVAGIPLWRRSLAQQLWDPRSAPPTASTRPPAVP